jgi:hypothetical protein
MANEQDDSLEDDIAYEEALDAIPGMPGQEGAIVAHILSESGNQEPDDTAEETLDRERTLAVQKSQDSSRPKAPTPFQH